jgi:hypothetical protein
MLTDWKVRLDGWGGWIVDCVTRGVGPGVFCGWDAAGGHVYVTVYLYGTGGGMRGMWRQS